MSFDPDIVPDYTSLLRLDGRIVVVLGAGAGMGRQSAHALAQLGGRVACVDRDEELARQVASEIGGTPITADVTDRGEMERVFERAGTLGPVTGLVDVVGIATIKPVRDFSDADWDRQFDLTVRHAFLAVQVGGRAIAEAGGGSMVFVGSTSGHTHAHGQAVYGAAKAALHRLVSSAAHEYGPQQVRANVLAPGFTRTPRLNRLLTESQWEEVGAGIPRGRAGTPAEIAAAVLFLISDLSSYVNGQVVTADGGMTGAIKVPF
ncbi:SDR family NAD(P)-dependent oxidoreductase [Actinomadura welshii]|uniref:SDR family NAD(P)-dependent oxidoreductase n=1 Tax=Actinomadura welshii TaxID=3103817 RepID=UPI0003AD0FE0|nr:SDR family oxidoreductase [Actinomadura madurae]